MNWRDRIHLDPQVLVGKPVVRGTRISVEQVLKVLGDGWSEADVLDAYPHLKAEDVKACLAYAAEMLSAERVFPLSA